MNLCNGGAADCYEGDAAIGEAGGFIYALSPDLVTLNEICLGDVKDHLFQTMGEQWLGDWVYYAFWPAWDRRTDGPYHCKNGDLYGNAVMGHVPPDRFNGVNAWAGKYIDQYQGTPPKADVRGADVCLRLCNW
jgi:hypothetical protein